MQIPSVPSTSNFEHNPCHLSTCANDYIKLPLFLVGKVKFDLLSLTFPRKSSFNVALDPMFSQVWNIIAKFAGKGAASLGANSDAFSRK